MPQPDLEQIAESVVLSVKSAVRSALAGVSARLMVLESRGTPRDGIDGQPGENGADGAAGLQGDPGIPGKDADPVEVLALKAEIVELRQMLLETKSLDVRAMVAETVAAAVADLPRPQDGKDGTSIDPFEVKSWVAGEVQTAIAALPPPQAGRDGQSVTIDDVSPLVELLVTKAVAAIPTPKEALGIKAAVVDRAGHLILTMTDSAEKDLGSIVGKDGEPGLPGVPGRNGQDGEPGQDGLGFDDIQVEHDGERTFTHKYKRGDRVKAFPFIVPVDIYRGVYVLGKTYERGDGVTWNGSEWHCNETTKSKPGDGSKDWTLKVKSGRNGRDGRDLVSGPSPLPVVTR